MKNKTSFPLFHLSLLSLSIASVMAQAAETVANKPADSEEIVVTGYRAALQNSTAAKKDSVGFSETVFADDMGKMPSQNIAESLSRDLCTNQTSNRQHNEVVRK